MKPRSRAGAVGVAVAGTAASFGYGLFTQDYLESTAESVNRKRAEAESCLSYVQADIGACYVTTLQMVSEDLGHEGVETDNNSFVAHLTDEELIGGLNEYLDANPAKSEKDTQRVGVLVGSTAAAVIFGGFLLTIPSRKASLITN